ncbi:hypothetical protein IW148_005473 [Coemansia sp. RSA 1199]|nr:hypothetical protein IW148_005473 [Coemansia sp. RSA 1199]
MVFIHIVLLPVRSGVHAGQINEVVAKLNDLVNCIPFVVRSSCGRTVTERGKQYTHALVVELERADQLPLYADHPAHQAVLSLIKEIIGEETLAMDFDTGV